MFNRSLDSVGPHAAIGTIKKAKNRSGEVGEIKIQ